MRILFTFLLSGWMLFSFAQKRTIDIKGVKELSFGIPGNLYLKQGKSERFEIECDDDIFDDIEFERRGNKLIITKENYRWGSGWKNSEVKIYMTAKELEKISVSGSGSLESEDQWVTENLSLSISGSGDMKIGIKSKKLELRISGSGSAYLNGDVEEATAKISGSGKAKAADLTVANFKASISGSGSCYVTVTDEIKASISGSGSVYYSGNPDKVQSNSSGSGKIRKQ